MVIYCDSCWDQIYGISIPNHAEKDITHSLQLENWQLKQIIETKNREINTLKDRIFKYHQPLHPNSYATFESQLQNLKQMMKYPEKNQIQIMALIDTYIKNYRMGLIPDDMLENK